MSSHVIKVQDLVIPSGGTDSNVLYARRDYADADGLTFYAPTVMPETVTIYVAPIGNPDSPPAAADFKALQRNGTDQTIPAGKAETLDLLPYKAIKLVASAAVAADRTVQVNKIIWA